MTAIARAVADVAEGDRALASIPGTTCPKGHPVAAGSATRPGLIFCGECWLYYETGSPPA